MQRITIGDLKNMCDELNIATGANLEARDAENRRARVGSFTLSGAYGGWTFQRMECEAGGVSHPIFSGYRSKREAYALGAAYLEGLRAAKGRTQPTVESE